MMLDRKREAKKHALLMANLNHQNQLLTQQFNFLADALDECSKGNSSLSSIASIISAAQNLSFSSTMTLTLLSTVFIGKHLETAIFSKESPTNETLTQVITETKASASGWASLSKKLTLRSHQQQESPVDIIPTHLRFEAISNVTKATQLAHLRRTRGQINSPPKSSKKHCQTMHPMIDKHLQQKVVQIC
jgi:hypothetical protein